MTSDYIHLKFNMKRINVTFQVKKVAGFNSLLNPANKLRLLVDHEFIIRKLLGTEEPTPGPSNHLHYRIKYLIFQENLMAKLLENAMLGVLQKDEGCW